MDNLSDPNCSNTAKTRHVLEHLVVQARLEISGIIQPLHVSTISTSWENLVALASRNLLRCGLAVLFLATDTAFGL